MDIRQQIATMVGKLASYHWSPEHPSRYTITLEGRERGIGVIAHKNYGAFNLAWGTCNGKWQTREEQHALVVSFSKFQALTDLPLHKEPVGDWACLLRPDKFKQLIVDANDMKVDVKTDFIRAAVGALNVQHV